MMVAMSVSCVLLRPAVGRRKIEPNEQAMGIAS